MPMHTGVSKLTIGRCCCGILILGSWRRGGARMLTLPASLMPGQLRSSTTRLACMVSGAGYLLRVGLKP
jgi:hypothetical protein